MTQYLVVAAKEIVTGDRIWTPWELNSNLVVSVTPDSEFEGIVEIKTEGDAWVGSADQSFRISRETNGQRLVRMAKAAGMFATDPEEF